MTDAVRSEGEGMVRAQNVTARHLEQQPSVQLGELIAQITGRVTASAQLASDVATAGRDRVHNQSTDALSTGLWLEQGVEVFSSQVTGSMPGK